MVFIIVVQFSLKNIKSIGLRWEIKKASIVSSNLGILAPVLERNCSLIKVIFFFCVIGICTNWKDIDSIILFLWQR